jgi:cytochrome o ubiquinol oxidase subunit 3
MSAAEQALATGDAVPLSLRGPAPTRVVAGYGFWLFLLSDIVIFAALFAAYAVLSGESAGGPTGADLFDKKHVLIETACLLASSVTCGFGSLAVQSGERTSTYFWMTITFILGVTLLILVLLVLLFIFWF